MENYTFSYAKRKILVIPIITLMIVVLICLVSANPTPPLSSYITYPYDNYSDGIINNSLWTNVSTDTTICTTSESANSYVGIDCIYSNFPRKQATASISTNNLPPVNYIENLTVLVNSLAHCGSSGCILVDLNYIAFGTNLFGTILGGGFSTSSDSSVWTFKRNGTKFDVYKNGSFNSQITPSNNIISGTLSVDLQPNDGGDGHVYIYIMNYTMNDKIITVNSTYPPANAIYNNGNITFNGTAITNNYNIGFNSLVNMSLYIDGIFYPNYTVNVTGTGVLNYSSFNVTDLSLGSHVWSIQACDNSGSCTFSDNRTIEVSYLTVVSQNYTTPVYETSAQYFQMNVEFNTVVYPTAFAYFNYNGVIHTTNINKIVNGNNVTYNTTIDIPTVSGTTTYPFHWDLYSNASTSQSTVSTNQTAYQIDYSICGGAGGSVPYINMNYLSETDSSQVNLSVLSSTWSYWLGSGTVKKSYNYNTAVTNYTHSFCFNPPYKILFTGINYQYGIEGIYPPRLFTTSVFTPPYYTLTNNTLNQSLYTISTSQSSSFIFQISDSTSASVIPNALVVINRNINGVSTTIYSGLTGSDGTVSVWLSSTTPYTITASKSGCGSNTATITPVGSYNMQLNCAGNLSKYTSDIDGIYYRRTPADGASTSAGNINYEYYVQSSLTSMTQVKFLLVDGQGTIVATNETNVSDGYSFCTNDTCLLTLQYTTACGDNIKGRYYVNLGNSSNYTYILLEGDAYWKYICINENNSQLSFMKMVDHFNQFFYQWSAGGQQGTTCRGYDSSTACNAVSYCKWVSYTGNNEPVNLCILKDNYNKAEFSRVLFIFFCMVIVLFIMGKTTGYEMTNPGSFVMFMTGAIIIMSFVGMFRFSGATPWAFFDQWIYAFICFGISLGYNISIVRRYSV